MKFRNCFVAITAIAAIIPNYTFADQQELYSELLKLIPGAPTKQRAGLASDLSATVCPIVSAQKLEVLNRKLPELVVSNIGLSENSTGFPAGTTHWIIKGHWLDPYQRMVLAVNVNPVGFCTAFAGPLIQDEPNFDLALNDLAEVAPQAGTNKGVVIAGQHRPMAECIQMGTSANGLSTHLDELASSTVISALGPDATKLWSVELSAWLNFDTVSFATITLGVTSEDDFYREVWPIIEGCESAR